MRGKLLTHRLNEPGYRIRRRAILFAAGLLLGVLPISGSSTPPPNGTSKTEGDVSPSVRIRAEEFFGVNDDDDNSNEIIDSDPLESPFRDANGNLMSDDNLAPAQLDLINPSGRSLEGYRILLLTVPGMRLWNSPCKEYELTNAAFTIDAAGVPRWKTPDGIELIFQNRVFVEGVDPGSGIISIVLLDPKEAGTN